MSARDNVLVEADILVFFFPGAQVVKLVYSKTVKLIVRARNGHINVTYAFCLSSSACSGVGLYSGFQSERMPPSFWMSGLYFSSSA